MLGKRSAFFLALAVALCGAANAQDIQDAVAQVGARTPVPIPAPKNSQLALQKKSFKGSAEIILEPSNARHSLIVAPDRTEVPTELSVLRQNKVLKNIRVYPVITQAEQWTAESRAAPPDSTSRSMVNIRNEER